LAKKEGIMKNKALFLLVTAIVSGFLVLSTFALTQEQKSQLYSIVEIVVKPAMVAKYEAAIKKEIELGYPYAFDTYSSDDFHYYFLTPIENYASIEAISKARIEWAKKIGDQHPALIKSIEGTVEYFRKGVIRYVPELSYIPKKPRLKPEEKKFLCWSFCYVEFNKEKEFAGIAKEWVELYKSKNIGDGWSFYGAESGTEMPFCFFAMSGKSPADFFSEDEKAMKKIGEEKYMELGKKMNALLRKYEFKMGRPRPDLSNMPKQK